MFQLETVLKNDEDIFNLYESLDWNREIKKSHEALLNVMTNSYYLVYVYDQEHLIGTGRMISDGYLTALICGVGVAPQYQQKGIGKMIIEHLKAYGVSKGLFVELTCVEGLESYYKQFGFEKYGIAMK